MKKAVIVIDMPKNCDECRFNYDMGNRCDALDEGAEHNTRDMYQEVRPCWCPLRPLPEKWERQPYNSQSRVDWKIGYNDCLDDIQGIEDEQERANKWWAEHSSRFD